MTQKLFKDVICDVYEDAVVAHYWYKGKRIIINFNKNFEPTCISQTNDPQLEDSAILEQLIIKVKQERLKQILNK